MYCIVRVRTRESGEEGELNYNLRIEDNIQDDSVVVDLVSIWLNGKLHGIQKVDHFRFYTTFGF